MIRVSVLYPNSEGKRFDHDYYANKHITMVAERVGGAMVKCEIDKGIAGMPPGQPAPFCGCGTHVLRFDRFVSGCFWCARRAHHVGRSQLH